VNEVCNSGTLSVIDKVLSVTGYRYHYAYETGLWILIYTLLMECF